MFLEDYLCSKRGLYNKIWVKEFTKLQFVGSSCYQRAGGKEEEGMEMLDSN